MIYLTENELKKYGNTSSLSMKCRAFASQQKNTWKLLSDNYRLLNKAETQTYHFGHFHIISQFNPERIRSTNAQTDAKTQDKRPCFLCVENRPKEQKAIEFFGYDILMNPYPIFPVHLTIPKKNHEAQKIRGHETDFIALAEALSDFVVFYNGPAGGASIPEHLHFQAISKGNLPIENEIRYLLRYHSEEIIDKNGLKIHTVENYLRRILVFQSTDENRMATAISETIEFFDTKSGDEPMLNLLGWFEDGIWTTILFPRLASRPSEYFDNEPARIMVSPAAVEMSGVLILPREKDFRKLTIENVISIFEQVTCSKNSLEKVLPKIKSRFL